FAHPGFAPAPRRGADHPSGGAGIPRRWGPFGREGEGVRHERRWKRLVRRWACGAALILLACSLAACWDRREVDEIAIVLTMAIDAGEEPGSLVVSYEIVDPGGIAAGQTEQGPAGGGGGSYVISAPGRTVRDAGQQLQRRQSR